MLRSGCDVCPRPADVPGHLWGGGRRAVPPDIAMCKYYTGIGPFTKNEVYVARHLRDRKLQRAPLQFFKPENWFAVREALIQAGK